MPWIPVSPQMRCLSAPTGGGVTLHTQLRRDSSVEAEFEEFGICKSRQGLVAKCSCSMYCDCSGLEKHPKISMDLIHSV